MYEQEKITPYGDGEAKGRQVAAMFDNIAHSYDRLNHLLSFGIDRRWRREALLTLRPHNPRSILDVATGTGDFAILAARLLAPERLVGVDISEGMLQVGREKVLAEGLDGTVEMMREDCMSFSFADDTFDAATVAYGVRNFESLDRGLAEMRRVLRPGGRLVIIELTTPRSFPMKQIFGVYTRWVMPLVGRLLSRDGRAYSYLPATMEAFPRGEEMKAILEKAGFRNAAFRRFTFGISTLYTAEK